LGLVSKSPKDKKALEGLLHPLVFADIEKKIAATKARRLVLDVPLLMGSPLEKECDLIIAILASEKAQEARLAARGADPKKSLALNQGWPRGAAKKAAGIVLDGSGDLPALEKQLDAYKFL
jgi:dephospho-CoA kinase